jgi:hypothetical protein
MSVNALFEQDQLYIYSLNPQAFELKEILVDIIFYQNNKMLYDILKLSISYLDWILHFLNLLLKMCIARFQVHTHVLKKCKRYEFAQNQMKTIN